jgi:hypothetical protein
MRNYLLHFIYVLISILKKLCRRKQQQSVVVSTTFKWGAGHTKPTFGNTVTALLDALATDEDNENQASGK